ncbi:MAG: SRPBCC domain-containing protein, partial [Sphingomonadales bacterium]
PRELVFDCMTKAEHLARWWGPRGFDVPLCESDPVAGGRLVLHMRGPEPYGTNPVEGEFVEVSPSERLSFVLRGFPGEDGSWGIEHLTTIEFSDAPDGGTLLKMATEVKQVSEALRPALGGMREGWSQSLDKMAELLADIG